MSKVCAFFGHSELFQDISTQLEDAIIGAIDQGYDIFWCGGYGTFDRNAAAIAHNLQKRYPHIQTVLILAYLPEQPLPELYNYSIFPEGIEIGPPRFAISRRNQWIVKHCDSAICYVNHSYGGAYTAFQSLKHQNKVLTNLGSFPSHR